MAALGYPVFFRKSSGLCQGSRNIRALTIPFSSQPSLKYLGLSMRMLKEQCSLQKGAYVCMSMHIDVFMCAHGLLVLDEVLAKGYRDTVKWRQLLDFFEVPRAVQFHLALRLLRAVVILLVIVYTFWQGAVLVVWTWGAWRVRFGLRLAKHFPIII